MVPYLSFSLISVFVLMIFDLITGFGSNKLWIALGLFIYGIYLVIDIQRLLSESRYGMTLDDYIVGAILIYLDIIMIFIKILRLIGKKKD
jgi:protein lifeguard